MKLLQLKVELIIEVNITMWTLKKDFLTKGVQALGKLCAKRPVVICPITRSPRSLLHEMNPLCLHMNFSFGGNSDDFRNHLPVDIRLRGIGEGQLEIFGSLLLAVLFKMPTTQPSPLTPFCHHVLYSKYKGRSACCLGLSFTSDFYFLPLLRVPFPK